MHPLLATAIKRLWPDRLVFTYQGDGDLACIGTAETIHALNRGENITIIFINNAIYGMTGGQMAPTTLVGMKTSTSPYGRDVHLHGYPLKMADIAAQLEGTAYRPLWWQHLRRSSCPHRPVPAVLHGNRIPQSLSSVRTRIFCAFWIVVRRWAITNVVRFFASFSNDSSNTYSSKVLT